MPLGNWPRSAPWGPKPASGKLTGLSSRLLKNGVGRHSPCSLRFSQRPYDAFRASLRRGVQARNVPFRQVKTQLSPDLYGLNCQGH